jgi:hypothetical protein
LNGLVMDCVSRDIPIDRDHAVLLVHRCPELQRSPLPGVPSRGWERPKRMPARASFVVRDHYVARLLTMLELLSSAYRLAKS